ncbi:hypothetical protein V9T40_011768 [Parthenolecanium corni]|uniref:Uncharacterized protein n=1 Tax=Parthenolecanium corni TaxID=536013 RepID=A0AAN9T5Y0_9HEMI
MYSSIRLSQPPSLSPTRKIAFSAETIEAPNSANTANMPQRRPVAGKRSQPKTWKRYFPAAIVNQIQINESCQRHLNAS